MSLYKIMQGCNQNQSVQEYTVPEQQRVMNFRAGFDVAGQLHPSVGLSHWIQLGILIIVVTGMDYTFIRCEVVSERRS